MRYLKKFVQYDPIYEGLLLEKVLHFGEKLRQVLKGMKHPYAKLLINGDHGDVLADNDNSYIEYSPKLGMVSWLPANREIDFQTKRELTDQEKWTTSKRQEVAISRVVTAVFAKHGINITESELEKFINEYKAIQNPSEFKLVKGNDIIKYYNEDSYEFDDQYKGCSLYGSCMRHDRCASYMSVYAKNPNVSLCVLFNGDKVQGRAVVWHNATIDGEQQVYMDRIYAISDSITNKFKMYAHSNGWWCKERQGVDYHVISNGSDKKDTPKIKVVLPEGKWESWEKPYMDTLRYLSYDIDGGKYIPVLFNYFMQTNTNWKQKWDDTDGDYHSNSDYVDPLREIKNLAANTGLDFDKLVLVNPIKIESTPEIWKVEDNNILLMTNYSSRMSRVLRDESSEEKNKLVQFFETEDTNNLIRQVSMTEIGEEYRSDIMMHMLDNIDTYVGGLGRSTMNDYVISNFAKQIISQEVSDNFSKVRDHIIVRKPKTFARFLNDQYDLNLNIEDADLLKSNTTIKNEYYTKLKENDKSKYYLSDIIENLYNEEEGVREFCKDYVERYILREKTTREIYDNYIGDSRQRKMDFISTYFSDLVNSVNITYLLNNAIKESPENIRKFAIKYILSHNNSYVADRIINSRTEEGMKTRMEYVEKIYKGIYPNIEVLAELRGNMFSYKVIL